MSRLLEEIEKKRAALLSVKEGAENARKHAKEVSTGFTRGITERA